MLKEKLLDDLKNSMKEKNVIRKNVIQMVRAAILQVEKDKQIEVSDDQIVEIIAKEAKKRKDSIVDYEKSGRQDLLDQINQEIAILEEYLPEQLSAEEIEAKVKEIIAELGATSMKEMGLVMKTAKEKLGASADGKTINEVAKKLQEEKEIKFLAQGTIYPDVIESAGDGVSHTIKSHHNVGGLPKYCKFQLIEPLRDLFKDEVRKIGLKLGLSEKLIKRHPFPGPGLGVRVVGEVTEEKVRLLQEADNIFIEELINHNLYDKVNQAFVVLLPVKSVGVMGDVRTYEYVVALRSVNTIDFMTATWSKLPYEFLEIVSNRIVNEIRGINRVLYDISSKPAATIEFE